ncbi:MAG: triose-phosphate isomerase [Eubacteriales bacterium]|nr:triose-phosphate isomerase [Eubacteriales bacterium]
MLNTKKMTHEDINVEGKRVLMRVDFNVPLDKTSGEITDDQRIVAALPSIRNLLSRGARLILVSHLGRPKGVDSKLSLAVCSERLSQYLDQEVLQAEDVIGTDAKEKAAALENGQVMLLENVRFHSEETENDPEFARSLAALADLYVNDAFGTAHRAHASTAGVASFLPGVSGYLIQKELEMIGGAVTEPKRPFTAVMGGAKVSDKIGVIRHLLSKVDHLILGGGMAYTFLAAKGWEVGTSLLEADKIDLARELMAEAEAKGVSLSLPQDTVIANEFAPDADKRIVASNEIPSDWMGLDIGPLTRENFSQIIKESGTVVWNGPMGVFELPAFAEGTKAIADAMAETEAVTIIGGGDSAAAVKQFGLEEEMTHISTGGGASLELLEGRVLPGVDCLMDFDPRRTVAAGNWKMNKGVPSEAVSFVEELKAKLADAPAYIIVAPPFTALDAVLSASAYSNIHVAAQAGHEVDSGAYTGSVSMATLAKMHVPYVLIGHSERRAMDNESDERIQIMMKSALNWGLRPILCCGESLGERELGETEAVLTRQIEYAFEFVTADKLVQITVAYEPIWAIGTGVTATVEQAQEACAFIRSLLEKKYPAEWVERVKVLYGGSVNDKNAAELFAADAIDGGLVGGASLKADAFNVIANA